MKTISAGMTTHLALNDTTLAIFCKVRRKDGQIFGFSEFNEDVDFDLGDGDGTITYRASQAFTRSAIKQRGDQGIDNLNIFGHLESTAITVEDLRAGVWDEAVYHIFMLNHQNLALGDIPLGRGNFGKVTTQDNEYSTELLSIMNRFNQDLLEVYSPACHVDLGSTGNYMGIGGCNVKIDPPTWSSGSTVGIRQLRDAATGTVVQPTTFIDRYFYAASTGVTSTSEPTWSTAIGSTTTEGTISWIAFKATTLQVSVATVVDNATFTITYSGDAASSDYAQGLVEWTSTADENFGRKMEILSFTSTSNTVELWAPMASDVSTGATLKMKQGCNKTLERCKQFDNVENFQGFPHIPGLDRLYFYPNAKS